MIKMITKEIHANLCDRPTLLCVIYLWGPACFDMPLVCSLCRHDYCAHLHTHAHATSCFVSGPHDRISVRMVCRDRASPPMFCTPAPRLSSIEPAQLTQYLLAELTLIVGKPTAAE